MNAKFMYLILACFLVACQSTEMEKVDSLVNLTAYELYWFYKSIGETDARQINNAEDLLQLTNDFISNHPKNDTAMFVRMMLNFSLEKDTLIVSDCEFLIDSASNEFLRLQGYYHLTNYYLLSIKNNDTARACSLYHEARKLGYKSTRKRHGFCDTLFPQDYIVPDSIAPLKY